MPAKHLPHEKKNLLFVLMLVVSASTLRAQQKVIQLYNGAAPASENWNWNEKFQDSSQNMFRTDIVYDVAKPTLTVYAPNPSVANGTAIVICPGGGFHLYPLIVKVLM